MAARGMRLFFDEQVLDEVVFLAEHADKFTQILAHAAELPAGTAFSAIVKHVTGKVAMSPDDVERLLSTVQNIHRTQARMRVDASGVVEEFTEAIAEYSKSKGKEGVLAAWQKVQGELLKALNAIGPDHPLQVARKMQRLFNAHQNVLTEVKLITDLRPVFDKAGTNILHMIVAQTLLIDYYDGFKPSRIEIGLDATDLADLRRACERAEGKAVALKESMKDKPWPTTTNLDDVES